MNYIVRDRAALAEPKLMLSILRVLVRCDTSTAWMVQRIVEFALLSAETVDKSSAAVATTRAESDDSSRRLVALANEIHRKCGAAIRQDVSLLDALHLASGAKAELASVLLNGSSSATRQSEAPAGSRSVSALFRLAPARPQSAGTAAPALLRFAAEYERLWEAPAADQVASGLKAVQRLRAAAGGASEAAGWRLLELVLQLKQEATDLSEPVVRESSSPVAASSTPVSEESLRSSAHLLPPSIASGCDEIVELASALYVKESQLSYSARADLLQVRASAWPCTSCVH